MTSKRNFSEIKTLDIYSTTLDSTRISEDISKAMLSVGYNAEKLSIGEALLARTEEAYRNCNEKKYRLKNMYSNFSSLRKTISESYSIQRKKAKVALRNDKRSADKLGLNEEIPRAYATWLEMVRKFYATIENSPKIQKKLAEFNFDESTLAAEMEKIRELEELRAKYHKYRAESQQSTKDKDKAFDELYEWMKDFYVMAKIALRKNPKLMVAFNKGSAITRK